VTAFLMMGAISAAAFLMSQYFQFALGYSPLVTGLRLLPWTLTPLLVTPLAGLLSDRIGGRPVLVAGMTLQGVGLACIALIAAAGAGYAEFVLPLVIAGIGISMALPVVANACISSVSPADIGKASGVNSTLQRFGAAFAVAIAAAVFTANGHLGTPVSFTTGFRPALGLVAGLSVIGAISGLGIGAGRRRSEALPELSEVVAAAG